MQYINAAGMQCPRIILGTAEFGSTFTESASLALMDYYVANGGTMLDTAEVYGDWGVDVEKSPSEKCVGKWLRSNRGAPVLISTKGAHYRIADPQHTTRVRPECIREDMEKSLENLGVDAIDIYWLHRDDPSYPVEPIMDALFACRKKGYVKHLGASNWSFARMEAANRYAAACGEVGFEASQTGYAFMRNYVQAGVNEDPDTTMLYFDEPKDTPYCVRQKLPIFAYSSQANGYITKVLAGRELSKSVRRSYDSPFNRARAARAGTLAAELGVSAEAVGLAYLFTRPFDVFAIIGPRTVPQLVQSMQASELTLTQEQQQYLAKDILDYYA